MKHFFPQSKWEVWIILREVSFWMWRYSCLWLFIGFNIFWVFIFSITTWMSIYQFGLQVRKQTVQPRTWSSWGNKPSSRALEAAFKVVIPLLPEDFWRWTPNFSHIMLLLAFFYYLLLAMPISNATGSWLIHYLKVVIEDNWILLWRIYCIFGVINF